MGHRGVEGSAVRTGAVEGARRGNGGIKEHEGAVEGVNGAAKYHSFITNGAGEGTGYGG